MFAGEDEGDRMEREIRVKRMRVKERELGGGCRETGRYIKIAVT